MGLRQVQCMEMDINSGFKSVVNQEVNEALVNLQRDKCEIIRVSEPIVNGRKVYITIEYDDTRASVGEDENVAVRTSS